MLGGGAAVKQRCRWPQIVADAAYIILTSDSYKYTGNFDVDEDVLKRSGVTDFGKYSCVEGECYVVHLHPLFGPTNLEYHGMPEKASMS